MTLKALETEIGQSLQKGGKHMVAQACRAMEAEILEQKGSKYLRDKRRPRAHEAQLRQEDTG